MSLPTNKNSTSDKLKKINFLEELYQTSERKTLYLKAVIEKLQEVLKIKIKDFLQKIKELKLIKEKNESLVKETSDLKQENLNLKSFLCKNNANIKEINEKNCKVSHSKLSNECKFLYVIYSFFPKKNRL